MEKNPKKRYTNAMEMLTDIRALRQNEKTVFGNEKNSSRYRVIERKSHVNAPNVSNRPFYPLSERGAEAANNIHNIKKNTAHSGTFVAKSGQIVYQTGKTRAITGANPAMQTSSQRLPSGALPPTASQRLPKASNTVALDNEINMKKIKNEGSVFSAVLGIIAALMLVIFLSLGIWFIISPSQITDDNPTYSITETEIEWNTEHTEKF